MSAVKSRPFHVLDVVTNASSRRYNFLLLTVCAMDLLVTTAVWIVL